MNTLELKRCARLARSVEVIDDWIATISASEQPKVRLDLDILSESEVSSQGFDAEDSIIDRELMLSGLVSMKTRAQDELRSFGVEIAAEADETLEADSTLDTNVLSSLSGEQPL